MLGVSDPKNYGPVRALIDGAGSPVIASHIRWMREAGYKVVVIDIIPDSTGFHLADRGYQVPPYSENTACAETIKRIIADEKINMILPVVDEGLLFWSCQREDLASQNIFLPVSGPESIAICNDKFRAYEFLLSIGVPTPHVSLTYDKELLLVKPRIGRGSAGVSFYSDKPPETIPEGFFYQEYVDGKEYTVDLLCDAPGDVVYTIPRQRQKTKSGASIKGIVVRDDEIEHHASYIAEKLKLYGPVNLQCIKNKRGCFFIDLNPRISGGQTLSLYATENWYLRYPEMAVGERIKPVRVRAGAKMFRYYNELLVD